MIVLVADPYELLIWHCYWVGEHPMTCKWLITTVIASPLGRSRTSNLGQVHFVKRIWDGPTSLPWWTRKPWNYDHSKRPSWRCMGFGGNGFTPWETTNKQQQKNNKHQTIDNKQLTANKPTTNNKKNTTNNNRAICIMFLLNAPWMWNKSSEQYQSAEPFKTSGTEGGWRWSMFMTREGSW